ncbi:MAG: hypothetical protein FJW96_17280 [Actinobacteria bacterium]|nr:hypothetical protein [Actinomycetota bacterium]MBM4269465.1 hypothetical protein [Deltaproteobacteria bacterium]
MTDRRPARDLLAATLAVVVALAVPSVASACAVCFGGEESDWTFAFTAGTILIMVMPPGIVATAVFVIYRSMKRRQAYLDAHAHDGASR